MQELSKNELMGIDGGDGLWGLLGDLSLAYEIASDFLQASAYSWKAYTDFSSATGGYYVTHITR